MLPATFHLPKLRSLTVQGTLEVFEECSWNIPHSEHLSFWGEEATSELEFFNRMPKSIWSLDLSNTDLHYAIDRFPDVETMFIRFDTINSPWLSLDKRYPRLREIGLYGGMGEEITGSHLERLNIFIDCSRFPSIKRVVLLWRDSDYLPPDLVEGWMEVVERFGIIGIQLASQ
jgi:hypothetical protein